MLKNFNVKIKIQDPEDFYILKVKFSKIAAKIIFNKIPPHLLNNYIEELETNITMNKHSL